MSGFRVKGYVKVSEGLADEKPSLFEGVRDPSMPQVRNPGFRVEGFKV